MYYLHKIINYSIFAELPSKIFVNQMSSDARAAGNEGGDEGDYDEDDEDNRHGIYFINNAPNIIL